jgi:hypothetical protein
MLLLLLLRDSATEASKGKSKSRSRSTKYSDPLKPGFVRFQKKDTPLAPLKRGISKSPSAEGCRVGPGERRSIWNKVVFAKKY